MKEVETEHSLLQWAKKAKRNEKIMYYKGFLMRDRQRYIMNGGLQEDQPQTLKTANFAWYLYANGVVNLTQKKKDIFDYEYIAVKR